MFSFKSTDLILLHETGCLYWLSVVTNNLKLKDVHVLTPPPPPPTPFLPQLCCSCAAYLLPKCFLVLELKIQKQVHADTFSGEELHNVFLFVGLHVNAMVQDC